MMLVGLLNRGYKPEFYTMLEPEMFKSPADRKVFKALKDGFRFSPYRMGDIREVAGLTYAETAELVTRMSEPLEWITEQDIETFVEAYRERKIKEYLSKGEIEKALEYTKEVVGKQSGIIEDYKRHLSESRKGADGGLLGLPTGLSGLDKVTSGFRKSKVWVVGGYNAYGKSYFLTNMVNKLIKTNRRACVITLEMRKEDIIDRIIGQRRGIGVYELAKTSNKDEVDKEIGSIEQSIEKMDLCILDSTYDISDIVRKVRIENKNRQIDVLFLDFIQLVRDKGSKTSYEALSSIATQLQELSKELGICSVILSQISNEAQKDKSYTTYGFKGAGEIGQVADVAMRIEREKSRETGLFTEDYTLDVVKNRSGQTGKVFCRITFPSGSITQKGADELPSSKEDDDYGFGNM